ncbi:MAG: hypothetical protein O2894_02215 [Planctomycetota bacterium]|nr:hypothetical protein [Planctomycetota bacterium]
MSDERIPVPIQATGYLRLTLPRAPAPGPAPVVMALHGHGQDPLAMLAYAESVAPPEALVVAIEGPQAFYAESWRAEVGARKIGYGWIADPRRADAEARNRDLLHRALDEAATRLPLDPARTVILGYSQGVGVAADFCVHARERVGALIGLAGGVPTANRGALDALAGLPVLWLTGRRDRFYTAEYSAHLVLRLSAAGLALDAEILDAGHGVLEPAAERVSAWISAHIRGAV